jgi:hypothetical protein
VAQCADRVLSGQKMALRAALEGREVGEYSGGLRGEAPPNARNGPHRKVRAVPCPDRFSASRGGPSPRSQSLI